ncbi:MAG: DUF2231 domain-containing protein, partial [Phycisphaerales bacterium]|nr:DUF2231 domain-containing protein [Phycisphaerales bacterium]
MSDFLNIFDALKHPAHRHAMLVHWPIALAILGLVLAVLAVLLPKNNLAKIVALGAYGLLLVMSWVTVQSGDAAHDAITMPLSNEVHELIERHEDMANKLWWFVAGALVLLIVGFFGPQRPSAVRIGASWIAVVINVIAVGWVSLTAHLGGTLVYEHGVGIRPPGETMGNQVTPTTAPASNHDHQHDHGSTNAPGDEPAPAHHETGFSTSLPADALALFRNEAWPILESRCLKCHNPARVAANKSGR